MYTFIQTNIIPAHARTHTHADKHNIDTRRTKNSFMVRRALAMPTYKRLCRVCDAALFDLCDCFTHSNESNTNTTCTTRYARACQCVHISVVYVYVSDLDVRKFDRINPKVYYDDAQRVRTYQSRILA